MASPLSVDADVDAPTMAYIQHIKQHDPHPNDSPRAMSMEFLRTFIPAIDGQQRLPLRSVAAWLEVRAARLRAQLLLTGRQFKQGRDYWIQRTAGSGAEDIVLSSDCFKELAMTTPSRFMDQVHTYFILATSLLFRTMPPAGALRV